MINNNYNCVNCKNQLLIREEELYCNNCKSKYTIHDNIPVLLKANLDSFKESEANFHNKEAENFSNKNRKYSYRVSKYHDDYLSEFKYLPKGSSVLEIGCGGGIESLRLSELGMKIYVSDISVGMVKKAKSLLTNSSQDNSINFLVCDAEELPFGDNSVDSILIVASLHHLPNPDIFFQEARRVLKPDGLMVVGFEPNRWPYYTVYPFMRFIGKFIKKTSKREDDVSIGDIETEGFLKKDFEMFISSHEFVKIRVQRIWYINGFVHTALARLNKDRSPDKLIDLPEFLQKLLVGIDEIISFVPLINVFCWHWNVIMRKKNVDEKS